MFRLIRKRLEKISKTTSTSIDSNERIDGISPKSSESDEVEDSVPKTQYNTRTIVKDYFESTTTHGLGRIFSSPNWPARVFWTLVLLVVCALLLRSVIERFEKLLTHDIVVQIRDKTQKQMEFPAVTICNLNPFRDSEIAGRIQPRRNGTYRPTSRKMFYQNLVQYFGYLSGLNSSLLYKAGHSGNEFIINEMCTFGNRKCSYPNNFTVFSTPYAGNCFTFNENGSLKQNRPGPGYGFHVGIDIGQDEYDKTMPWLWNFGSAGVQVIIHNPGDVPIPQFQGFYVAPGTISSIGLSKKKNIRLPHPFPDQCVLPKDAKKKLTGIQTDVKYTIELCLTFCYILEQLKYCGVVDAFVYESAKQSTRQSIIEYPIAKNPSQVKCILGFDSIFESGKISCDCPPPCEEDKFSVDISHAIWPSAYLAKQILNELKNKTGKEYARFKDWTELDVYSNFLAIQVHFIDFSVEEITQKRAYDWGTLRSEVGGLLGLFIGASIFSVLEFGSFLLELITYKCCKEKKKRKNSLSNNIYESRDITQSENEEKVNSRDKIFSSNALKSDDQNEVSMYKSDDDINTYKSNSLNEYDNNGSDNTGMVTFV